MTQDIVGDQIQFTTSLVIVKNYEIVWVKAWYSNFNSSLNCTLYVSLLGLDAQTGWLA